MAAGEQIEGLLADLQTITDTARAGVISKRDEVLEPGETRPAAILFVDIVGFTPLARKLTSEVLTKVVDRAFRIFELTVRAHGGYCDKVMGDAALYVFAGHPNYPPVCEAALRAALKLQDRLSQINESLGETGVHLAIRQGVAFGEVTRQAVGAEQAQLTVLGDTVNAAQRLQSTAQPDAIQTTVRVLEKAGDAFKHQMLGRLQLKGIGEVATYLVTGVEEQPVQLRGAFRRLSPLTGRDVELDQAVEQLKAWLQITYPPETWDITQMHTQLKGRNRLLILRGVPAVGKSRLAYEIGERLKAELGAVAVTAHCAEHAMLAQFTAELARVAGLTAENLPRRWEELCANATETVSPEYAKRQRGHLRILAYVLGCKEIDAGAIGQADPKSFTIGCQLALRACCELAAHETAGRAGVTARELKSGQGRPPSRPVILIIEDLQWLGGLKDVVADLLARACLPQPLIVIGTARPEYAPSEEELCQFVGAKPCFAQDGTVQEEGEARLRPYRIYELSALSREQGDALVQALLPGLALPETVAAELHEKAAGIPYFYEDFVRMLVRKGLVAPVGAAHGRPSDAGEPLKAPTGGSRPAPTQSWRLTTELITLDIPVDLQTLMLGRLDQLEADVRELARRASILGRSFQRDLLAAIETRLGKDHAGHPDDELSALLAEKLLAHGGGDLYFYEHALLHQAAYVSLLCANRRVLHLIAAEILASLHVPGAAGELELLEQLVGHLEASGQYLAAHQRACELMKTKASMLNLGGWDEWLARAVRLWEAAAGGTGSGSPGIQHESDSIGSQEAGTTALPRSARLHIAIAELDYRKGRYPEALHRAELVLTLARAAGDRDSEAFALSALGNLHCDQGRMEEARSCYEQSLVISRESGFRRNAVITLNNLALLHKEQGRIAEALSFYEQALKLARESSDRRGEAIILKNLGEPYYRQGRMEQARACYELSLAISRDLGDRRTTANTLADFGVLHHDQGRMQEAMACYEQALALYRELGDRKCEGQLLHNLGWYYADLGDLARAAACQLEALALAKALKAPYLRGICLSHLGRLYAWQGRLKESQAALEEGAGLLTGLHDIYQLSLASCSWVYHHLATAGFIPPSMRQAQGVVLHNKQAAAPSIALRAALDALAQADDFRAQIHAGPDSEPGQDVSKARAAIIDFAREHGLDVEVAGLIADHEREQTELARLRAGHAGDASQ